MKKIHITLITLLVLFSSFAQTAPCGSIFNDTFDEDGAIPTEWVEYNSTGQVTAEEGVLKLDLTTDKPYVYRTFNPVSNNFSYSFDVSSTRNYVNCNMNLISSTGEYIASFTFALLSNSNIQYASTIEEGVPSGYTGSLIPGTYATNTMYSISMDADFTNQEINIYNGGVLMAENIPFLQASQDVAKIDIQLNYMYSNEGRFFFDNVSLISTTQNRMDLTKIVAASETLLSTASIGEAYNQYTQSAYDTFEVVVNNAKIISTNCDASSEVIDQALADLQAAKITFEAARVNDPVLKLYSGYDFSGEEHKVYCGYYNGGLEAYDNWAVSFTLDKGYMATFAQDINGLGVSKVYVASKEDLRINLPEELQNSISFIRVSPWKDVHKKGIGAKGEAVVAAFNNSWHYNWGNDGEAIGDAEFVPNQWGGGSVAKAISLGERMDISHHMAFNEPDNDDQSNMTVDRAIEKYPELLASGLRLGSPANTDGAKGAAWRDEFMTKAEAAGLRVDYIVVHYYKKSTPTGFYNWLKAIHDKWQRPIWIKEFNYGAPWVNNKPTTNLAASEGLEAYINMLDDTDFIERYAVFTWQPDNEVYSLMSVRYPVTLSTSGEMYRDHESTIAYTQEEYEQGANLAVNDATINSEILVYPTIVNNGILNIKYATSINQKNVELTFYNTFGQQVKKVAQASTEINVGTLSKGLYLVKIKSDVGVSSKKIIIE